MKENTEFLDFENAEAWRNWLESHSKESAGVWLRIAKKGSEKKGITISEALDNALCYGWIDSQRKGYDESYYLQRYSPRRSKSPWSKLNVERAEALLAAGKMKPSGLLEIEAAKQDGRWEAAYQPQRNIQIPIDLETALTASLKAKEVFERLDKTGQYAIILPILKASTEVRRLAVIQKAIAKLEE